MKGRIALGLALLIAAILIFDSVRLLIARNDLFTIEAGTSTGPEDADLTLIEFVDYTNPAARTVEPMLREAIKRDGKVRLAPRPVFFDDDAQSRNAAILVYAAGRQGKFMQAHDALIENFRTIDDAFLSEFSVRLALDTAQLKKDYADPALARKAEKNRASLYSFKSKTTPTFLIGNKVMLRVYDALPDTAQFLTLFKQGRAY